MADQWLEERITKTKALIVAYEDALTALSADGIHEYSLNTGQTVTRVTSYDIAALERTLTSLEARLQRLQLRNGDIAGTIVMAPWR